MGKSDESRSERSAYLEVFVLGLTQACPVEDVDPTDRPLHDIRRLTIQERRAWVGERSAEELKAIACNHRACAHRKLLGR